MRTWAKMTLLCGFAAGLGLSAPVFAHTSQPVYHASVSTHHVHTLARGGGWHGYHHGYGFYGFWPWYFPVGFGYASPYYGTTFFVEAPVTYTAMAPEESGIVQPATSWYYCHDPEGYFPYVKTCASGWQTVPIQPVEPAPAAPAN